jgi:hypothetical protein
MFPRRTAPASMTRSRSHTPTSTASPIGTRSPSPTRTPALTPPTPNDGTGDTDDARVRHL